MMMIGLLIFSHVWFLQTFVIRCSENSTGVQAEGFISEDFPFPPAVVQFSVPEDHSVCLLLCGSSEASDVVWTHQDRKVLVTRRGDYETNENRHRYVLLSSGGLCLKQLDDSDSGEYRCNQQLVAELQVLTGLDFLVSAGRTLLIPCSGSAKHKQRWFHRRKGGKREAIFTRYRNGTVKREREDSRYSFKNDALQILDLHPSDSGEYVCNKELQGRLTVIAVHPEPTRIHSSTSPTPTSARKTDEDNIKRDEKKKPENALLMVAVAGFGLMIFVMVAVCVLLTSMKCRRKKKCRRAAAAAAAVEGSEDTELQPWTTSSRQTECDASENLSPPDEMIHYASLGRPTWREKPSRTPQDQDHHNVIYSSVITRPAADSKLKHSHAQHGMKFYI